MAYTYLIGEYEIINVQDAEFLNAVAATDTYDLYHTTIGSDRGLRGASFFNNPSGLPASSRGGNTPTLEDVGVGFRVANPASAPPVPSPGPTGVALLGGLIFTVAVAGLAVQRRRSAG